MGCGNKPSLIPPFEPRPSDIRRGLAVKPIKWTVEKPTKPGWYWCGDVRPGRIDFIVEIADYGDGQLMPMSNDIYISHNAKKLKWSGPIPKPTK